MRSASAPSADRSGGCNESTIVHGGPRGRLRLVGKADVEDATAHRSLYCEMVELYQAANGDQGWPEYDPAINCNN